MIIGIDQIKIDDRVRKDYGNLQELADDIEENGLINPPVINRDNRLLAGERRIRACKLLGWKVIEVRQMDTRDAEHELNVEISENDVRKEFTKSERVDYMKRLMRIEQAKAEERRNATLKQNATDTANLPEREEHGEARDIVASHFGIGQATMRKEMQIVEHKDSIPPADFADWDAGKLSTNKVFTKLQADLERSEDLVSSRNERIHELMRERERMDDASRDLKMKILSLEAQLRTAKSEVVETNVYPEDYNEALDKARLADAYKQDLNLERMQAEMKKRKIRDLESENSRLRELTALEQTGRNLTANALVFMTGCSNFMKTNVQYSSVATRLSEMPTKERKQFVKTIDELYAWAQSLKESCTKNAVPAET